MTRPKLTAALRSQAPWTSLAALTLLLSGCESDPSSETFTASGTLTDAFRKTPIASGTVSLEGANCIDLGDGGVDDIFTGCTNAIGRAETDAEGRFTLTGSYDPDQQTPAWLNFGAGAANLQSYQVVKQSSPSSGQVWDIALEPDIPSPGVFEFGASANPDGDSVLLTWSGGRDYWYDRFVLVRGEAKLEGAPAWGKLYAVGDAIGNGKVIFSGLRTDALTEAGAGSDESYAHEDSGLAEEKLYYYAVWPTDAYGVYPSVHGSTMLYTVDAPPQPVSNVQHTVTPSGPSAVVTLTWTAPPDDPTLKTVVVLRSETGTFDFTPSQGVPFAPGDVWRSSDKGTVDDLDVAEGQTVTYRLIAMDKSFHYSSPVDHAVTR